MFGLQPTICLHKHLILYRFLENAEACGCEPNRSFTPLPGCGKFLPAWTISSYTLKVRSRVSSEVPPSKNSRQPGCVSMRLHFRVQKPPKEPGPFQGHFLLGPGCCCGLASGWVWEQRTGREEREKKGRRGHERKRSQ